MKQGPDETGSTPLGEVLCRLSEEEAPSDLQARCLAALDAAEGGKSAAPAPRWELWRQLTAAAALLVMLVGVGSLFSSRGGREGVTEVPRQPAPTRWATQEDPAVALGTPMKTRPAPGGGMAYGGGAYGRAMGPGAGVPSALSPAAAPASPRPSAPRPAPVPTAPPRAGVGFSPVTLGESERESGGGRGPAPQGAAPRDELSAGRKSAADPLPERRAYTAGDAIDASVPAAAPSPNTPWRAQPGQRRKITTRQVDLETPDVEATYKQAVGIIEKAGGFVLDEELTLRDRGRDEARLQARIPVGQFDGVLAQVRELGHVVLLSGVSEDRTEQYETEAEVIRSLGAREEALTARYEAETNRTRKAQLLRQLRALRAELGAVKQGLRGLQHETSWASLHLHILQNTGLRYLFTQAAREALPLTFSLALIAVPLLVLALLLRRRR